MQPIDTIDRDIMKKYCLDFTVVNNEAIHELYSLLTLTPSDSSTSLPDILPGQFVQVRGDNAETFLRRPISVNDVDRDNHTLSLLVRNAGEGSRWIMNRRQGDTVNLMLPLGNGFGNIAESDNRPLLVGGGVGIAPMLYLGKCMSLQHRVRPAFLVGARSASDVLQLQSLQQWGDVFVTTEDGTMGEKGLVTASSVWNEEWTTVYCCGPAPMMKAIAQICKKKSLPCKVSLENMMACGLGACLCCVAKSARGTVCECTEGHVFDNADMTW